MLHIGCHLSFADGFLAMGETALEIGADTFQYFSRNPRGSKAKALDVTDAAALKSFLAEHHFAPVLAHAPYTMNACSADAGLRELAKTMMREDLANLEHLPGNLYNFHPGSHVGQGAETGISQIVETLNAVLRPEQRTVVLLETMAGKGSEIGSTFAEVREIIDRVEQKDKIGVCLDTCHIFSAGYDIVNRLDEVAAEFDKVIGLPRLRAVHLNDSLKPFGEHKDMHAWIVELAGERDGKGKGPGQIGIDALARFINHPAFRNLPFYLETPHSVAGYAAEIKRLRELFKE